jgi:transcriptional regulator with XRE-family HTH domain
LRDPRMSLTLSGRYRPKGDAMTLAVLDFDGAKAKAARKAAGMSREQVAVDLARSFQTIYNWERDLWRPSPGMRARLARLLGCEAIDLMSVKDVDEDAPDA